MAIVLFHIQILNPLTQPALSQFLTNKTVIVEYVFKKKMAIENIMELK